MLAVTYAYIGAESDAARFAKKGTASDITLFDTKKGDVHLNIVHPSRFPEKLQSLLFSLDLADEIILHPRALDRAFGEAVIGAELFGKTRGFVRLGGALLPDQVKQILDKTALRGLTVSEEPEGVFREHLYDRASTSSEGSTLVPVDHSFAVKGVGTVILGLVRSGEVATHQQLQAYPGDKEIEVRSIQVHDVDQKSAPTRCRVGLAVKGAEAGEVSRGTVLAPPGSLQVVLAKSPRSVRVAFHPFNKWVPRAGTILHLFHLMQDVVARVDAAPGEAKGEVELTLSLDTPLAIVPKQPAVLVDLDNKAQRFVGSIALS
jgi:selenocysteine-specific translation elongation factor